MYDQHPLDPTVPAMANNIQSILPMISSAILFICQIYNLTYIALLKLAAARRIIGLLFIHVRHLRPDGPPHTSRTQSPPPHSAGAGRLGGDGHGTPEPYRERQGGAQHQHS